MWFVEPDSTIRLELVAVVWGRELNQEEGVLFVQEQGHGPQNSNSPDQNAAVIPIGSMELP